MALARNEHLERRKKETHSLPRGRGLLHNGVIYRSILTDVVDPRVPLGRHLRGVEVVLRVVNPSMSA